MKRARIILSSLAILAVVGTALAFKAKNNKVIFCEDTNGQCTVKITGITTTDNQDQRANPCVNDATKYGAVSTTVACPTATVQFYNISDTQ
jgi:hypothetical protein